MVAILNERVSLAADRELKRIQELEAAYAWEAANKQRMEELYAPQRVAAEAAKKAAEEKALYIANHEQNEQRKNEENLTS